MLPIIISFGILWIACCAYAWLRGGWEGRLAATFLMVAVVASAVAAYFAGSSLKIWAMLAIDGTLLIALGFIAYRSDRYWPLWLVGLHLLTVCAEIAALIDKKPLAGAYEAVQAFWSIPALLVMALGVLLDRRADQRERESGHGAIPNPEPLEKQS